MFKISKGAALAVLLLAPAWMAQATTAQAATAPGPFNQCKACHRTEAGKNAVGPSLFGVVGRTAGTEPGFKYSPAMAKAGWVWTPEKLAEYIANPRQVVPGNKMAFAGVKHPEQVQEIVAYLETLK